MKKRDRICIKIDFLRILVVQYKMKEETVMAKNETNAKNSAQNSQDEQSKNGAKQAYKNANDTKSCTSDYKDKQSNKKSSNQKQDLSCFT